MYCGYGKSFDGKGSLIFGNDLVMSFVTFGVHNSSSSYVNNHEIAF